MAIIDADVHVEESKAMFDLLEKEYYSRRPLPVVIDSDSVYGKYNGFWLIDGNTCPKIIGRRATIFATPTIMERAKQKPISIPAQEMTDIEARLKDLDRMSIDRQVVYPTLFLGTTADDVKLEAALMRCYNSFMADACARSRGRLRFAALVPIRDVEESVRELRRAKSLGAVVAMLLGMAYDKMLGDKALYPLYEEAARLDIPIAIHFGWGSPDITNAFAYDFSDGRGAPTPSPFFSSGTLPVLMGFHSIMASGLMETFPRLRIAFLETGSEWLPYVIRQLKRGRAVTKDPADYFKEGRVYVACEADEDINYLVALIGEDSLVMGSDYPHGDLSHEENMVATVMGREDVPLRVREKLLSTNPARLYGL